MALRGSGLSNYFTVDRRGVNTLIQSLQRLQSVFVDLLLDIQHLHDYTRVIRPDKAFLLLKYLVMFLWCYIGLLYILVG